MIFTLRILALVLALGVVSFWFFRGADRGWSKTSIPIAKVDPVTEIEYVEYEERFVPGVDVLALGLISSGTLFFFSLVLNKSHSKN